MVRTSLTSSPDPGGREETLPPLIGVIAAKNLLPYLVDRKHRVVSVLDFSVNGPLKCLLYGVWFLWVVGFVRFLCIVGSNCRSFVLIAVWYLFHCVNTPGIHSMLDGHLGGFGGFWPL